MTLSRTSLLCDAAGFSRAEMARHLGCSPSHVSRLRDGYPEAGPIARLLDILAGSIGRPDLVRPSPESAPELAAPSPGKTTGVSP